MSDYSDEIVDALQDVEQAVSRAEGAVNRTEGAVKRVEEAVKGKWSSVQLLGWVVIGVFLWSIPGDIWHSRWRYSLAYDLSSDQVVIDERPHDCAFLGAPLGEKYCHYDRDIWTLHWATSTAGAPIASYDDGKTWNVFTPDAGVSVPKADTIKQVHISWKKVDE
jgi:hypothetical protein